MSNAHKIEQSRTASRERPGTDFCIREALLGDRVPLSRRENSDFDFAQHDLRMKQKSTPLSGKTTKSLTRIGSWRTSGGDSSFSPEVNHHGHGRE